MRLAKTGIKHRLFFTGTAMFSWKKDSADISDPEPTFNARYVGCTETFLATGPGCTTAPLQRLWDNAPHERYLNKVTVKLSKGGIRMKRENSEQKDSFFPIEDISFCAADKALNERLFCWIAKHPGNGQLEAYAVLCSTKEKAEVMATVLTRAFHLAYIDWKAVKVREERRCSVLPKLSDESKSQNREMSNSKRAISDRCVCGNEKRGTPQQQGSNGTELKTFSKTAQNGGGTSQPYQFPY